MSESIESFVKRLRSEGVDEGRAAAEKIEAEAAERATQIIRQAETQAADIRQRAENDAARHRERIDGELRLAVRDSVLALREALGAKLQRIISEQVKTNLSDEGFLKDLIREALVRYVQADSDYKNEIHINLTAEMETRLADWIMHHLREEIDPERSGYLELHGTLAKEGFEYQLSNGTVEVSTESVTKTLFELARPELRRLLSETDETVAGDGKSEPVPSQSSN